MGLETSAESPAPVRTVSRLLADWIGRLGGIWVEGQVAQISRRPGMRTIWITLRDTDADISLSVVAETTVVDVVTPAVAEGQRVIVYGRPEFYAGRGALQIRAREIRPVGKGALLEELERLGGERLIRAVVASRAPVVTAIGHEQDVPLVDLVADLRASTPTDAAKRVVPDVLEEVERLQQLRQRGKRFVERRLTSEAQDITRMSRSIRRAVTDRVERGQADITHLRARLAALSPGATLERGYAVVRAADGSVIRDSGALALGERLDIRVAQGRFVASVEELP
jgi:exonuclease VII large subunit